MPRKRRKKLAQPKYPAHQLVATYSELSSMRIATIFGVNRVTAQRWRNPKTMLNQWEADRYAVRIGKHPSQIWPEWFDIELTD
jgi:hypothetical protein